MSTYIGDLSLHGVTSITIERRKPKDGYEVARVVIEMGNTKFDVTLFSDSGEIRVEIE